MSRAWLAVALSLVTLAILGCGGGGDGGPAGGREVDYVNEPLAFGLDPIPEWSVEEGADRVTFSSPDGIRIFTVVVSDASGGSLISIMDGEIASIASLQPDARILDENRSYPVNLREGLRAKIRYTNDLGDRNLDLIVTSESGRAYVMMLEVPWIDFEGTTILGNFVSSFRFF